MLLEIDLIIIGISLTLNLILADCRT